MFTMTNTAKTLYCFMLVFSEDLSEVVLLTKKKGPAFLLGKLTGIGGKLEPGEDALTAAIREMKEETGLDISKDKWTFVSVNEGPAYRLDTFTAVGDIRSAKTNFDEEVVEPVSVHKVADILAAGTLAPDTIAPDLVELIHLALAEHNKSVTPPAP